MPERKHEKGYPGLRIRIAILLLALTVLTSLFARTRWNSRPSEVSFPAPAIVEVAGDVPKPGIYILDNERATVGDALKAAGWSGNLPAAGTGPRKLVSGESCRVLRSGNDIEITFGRMPAAALLAAGRKLDLNSASKDDLLLIPQMRPEIAEMVVERRKTRKWTRVEELQEIHGIGSKTVLRLKEHLEVSSGTE